MVRRPWPPWLWLLHKLDDIDQRAHRALDDVEEWLLRRFWYRKP